MQYRFTCDYKSNFGAWSKGDIAEFDDVTAAWLLRDVSGCIEPADAKAPKADETPHTREISVPEHDRQIRKAPRSR